MERTKTSILVKPEIWKKVKLHCIKIEKDISDFLEELYVKELKKLGAKN